MKKFAIFLGVFALVLVAIPTAKASANTTYYYVPGVYQPTYYQPTYGYQAPMSQDELVAHLRQMVIRLQAELAAKNDYRYRYDRNRDYDYKYSYVVGNPRGYNSDDDDDDYHYGDDDDNGRYYDDEPEAYTKSATDIEDDEARMRGRVDMNDFDGGVVFFVYGEDEDQVEDVEDDYDSYRDVDEDGDGLQKVRVDSSLDGSSSFSLRVGGLDDETDYYYQICVEYEDEDNDDRLVCGGTYDFETDD